MILERNITNKINWILDNLVPPILRDNRTFMSIWFKLLFGNKAEHFLDFKEKVPFLSNDAFEEYYRYLSDKHIERDTDLNKECLEKILTSIVGKSVLDVGCGRGYLAKRIASEKKIGVVGIDIIVPEVDHAIEGVEFVKNNVEKLPFRDKSFDTVICTHTLEHVLDIEKVVREIRRVAKKKIIIVVPRQREYKYTFDLHVHFFPYTYSLKKVMRNKNALCDVIENDIYYEESVG